LNLEEDDLMANQEIIYVAENSDVSLAMWWKLHKTSD
jgi:hypothetical protein